MTVCRMIRKWSWPDLRSDIVSLGKYERARNAAVRISDLWPHIYVQDYPGTKQELCQWQARKKPWFCKSFCSEVSGRWHTHTRLPGKQFTASRTEAKHAGANSTDRLNIRLTVPKYESCQSSQCRVWVMSELAVPKYESGHSLRVMSTVPDSYSVCQFGVAANSGRNLWSLWKY